MADILRIGSSTLLHMQQALAVTGHNIANVNTEGYSRQALNFATREATAAGFGWVGNGASIAGIARSHDQFVQNQIQGYAAGRGGYQAFLGLATRLDESLGSGSGGLNASLQSFFDAVQDLSGNPAGLPERQVLLSEAATLVGRQQKLESLMRDLDLEVNDRLRNAVGEINTLADSIASINRKIVSAASGGAQPNDLLDQRDRLIRRLSEKVSVNTVQQADGSMNVFIGKGQGLVVGAEVNHLEVRTNAFDAGRLEIGLAGAGEGAITRMLSGGEVQGLIDFRDRLLDPARAQLGLLALGLSETVNAQHRLGLDLNGRAGADFFATAALEVAANAGNQGSAVPAVSLADTGALQASAYLLSHDGSQWQLTRLSDDTSVSGPGPLSLDGLEVDLGAGTPAAGDSFLIDPAGNASASFRLALRDPAGIAAAAPLSAAAPTGNTGTGSLQGLSAVDAGSLPLGGPITLTFDPDALGAGVPGFLVNGGPGGTLAYDPASEASGKELEFPGLGVSFTLAGVPDAGDSFTIGNNTGGSGDNRNALALAGLQGRNLLEGGRSTFQELYGGMTARVGVSTRDAETGLEVESALLLQAEQQRESASGVNLDEEAANMLRYQQLYQAAARLVQVADELFQTLINAT